MTTLKNYGVPLPKADRPGLLQPMVAYRFRVLPLNVGGENSQIFCQQVQLCKLDLAKKTLTIDVRQTINREGFDAVGAVVGSCKSIVVDYLNSQSDVNFSVVLAVESINHELVMDYGLSANLMHRLVVTFSEYETMPGDIEAKPYPMINTGTDEFISPAAALDLINNAAKKVEDPEDKVVKRKHVKREADQG